MKFIMVIAFTLGIISCAEDQISITPSEIVGTWKLIEQLADPGDGSGEFTPVNSHKVIIFSSNGTYLSNGTTCFMQANVGQPSTGSFNWSQRVLVPEDCSYDNGQSELEISYRIEEANLILYYPCIEGCAQKYIKIED